LGGVTLGLRTALCRLPVEGPWLVSTACGTAHGALLHVMLVLVKEAHLPVWLWAPLHTVTIPSCPSCGQAGPCAAFQTGNCGED
jgi:hypothetical protein